MQDINGIIGPVLTPFEEGDLAVDRIEASVEYTVDCGCQALVAAGTGVQETVSLTIDEREQVVNEVVDAAPDDIPVFSGISHPASAVVERLIDIGEDAGADAFVAFPPWNTPPSMDEVKAYYRHITDATSTPVLMYDNPVITREINAETMIEIAGYDGIEYVKETSRSVDKISTLIEGIQHEGNADVFTTMDALLITLLYGGKGAIVPPPASRLSTRVYDAYEADDLETATRVQRLFGTFPPVDAGLTATLKAAAVADGVSVGGPRPPYKALSAEDRGIVADWFSTHS